MTNKDERLKSIVDRIVGLHEERDALGADIKEIMQEAKSGGYDLPALRLVIKWAREDADKRQKREEAENIAESMEAALGAFAETDLGKAAIERA